MGALLAGYLAYLFLSSSLAGQFYPFAVAVFHLINQVWWGLMLGLVFVGLLGVIPREFVMAVLGPGGGLRGIVRAALAGLLLDLCNHGILLVGMKLYDRGASLGQTMAFLIASPWNSFSLSLILLALIGLKWTAIFILLSALVAVVSGLVFEGLVRWKILPGNPASAKIPPGFRFWRDGRKALGQVRWNRSLFHRILVGGLTESRMILRWIFFGLALSACIQAYVSTEALGGWFGPTLAGLGLTLLAATVIEICSEGSTPIAADLVNRAGAPGNGFTFLMAGAATDYTEVMAVREQTRSWKVALFLPLVTVPQVLALGYLLNQR